MDDCAFIVLTTFWIGDDQNISVLELAVFDLVQNIFVEQLTHRHSVIGIFPIHSEGTCHGS